jgi:sn-glycerol 3-phosphate transport system permease protein
MSDDRAFHFDSPTGWRAVGRYGLLVVISVIVLFPVYTTVIAALKPGNKVLVNPLVPDAFTLDIFRAAWSEGNLGRYMLNSIVVAVIVTVAQIVTPSRCSSSPVATCCSSPSSPRCWCRSRRRWW